MVMAGGRLAPVEGHPGGLARMGEEEWVLWGWEQVASAGENQRWRLQNGSGGAARPSGQP